MKFSKNNGIIILAELFNVGGSVAASWDSQLFRHPICCAPHDLCTAVSTVHHDGMKGTNTKHLDAVVNIVQVDGLPVGLEVPKASPTTGGKTLFRITVTCDRGDGVHMCLKTEPKHTQNGRMRAPEKSAFFKSSHY